MKKYLDYSLVILVVSLAAIGSAQAAERCTFSRDLELGDVGDDVLCLQQYLNGAGFTIAASGAGSAGRETNTFRTLTREALIRWQTSKGITPASGYFGPQSRAAFGVESNVSPVTVTPPTPTPDPQILARQLEEKIRDLLKETRDKLDDTRDDIRKANRNGSNIDLATKLSDKAEDKLVSALYAFLDERYDDATDFDSAASNYLKDAREEVMGDGQDAEDAIDEANDAINDARDEINDADDNGDDVDEAKDILNDAKSKLKDARSAYDDEEYDDAVKLADRAEKFAHDAVDAIDN